MLAAAAAISCLSCLSTSLPHRQLTSEAEAIIVNGTSVRIGFLEEAFVYCMAEVAPLENLQQYRVAWQDPHGSRLEPWSSGRRVFCLGGAAYLPHSYLLFHDFDANRAGEYTCLLYRDDALVAFSTITVQESSAEGQ